MQSFQVGGDMIVAVHQSRNSSIGQIVHLEEIHRSTFDFSFLLPRRSSHLDQPDTLQFGTI